MHELCSPSTTLRAGEGDAGTNEDLTIRPFFAGIGAASILETLRANRSLLVVVNPTLMDNHQVELGMACCNGYEV